MKTKEINIDFLASGKKEVTETTRKITDVKYLLSDYDYLKGFSIDKPTAIEFLRYNDGVKVPMMGLKDTIRSVVRGDYNKIRHNQIWYMITGIDIKEYHEFDKDTQNWGNVVGVYITYTEWTEDLEMSYHGEIREGRKLEHLFLKKDS